MPPLPAQLPLALKLKRKVQLESFIAGDNRPALAALDATLEGTGESLLYFWGRHATGKSHLLLGACERAAGKRAGSSYLSLAHAEEYAPTILENLEGVGVVCLDDIDAIAGQGAWEEALFNLFNRMRSCGTPLIVSAKGVPSALPIQLPDLQSRLSWGATFHLQPLSDAGREEALLAGAHQLGIPLAPQNATWLLHHYSRDLNQLFALLDRIDTATLAAQRRPTRPFLQELLESEAAI